MAVHSLADQGTRTMASSVVQLVSSVNSFVVSLFNSFGQKNYVQVDIAR